MADHEVIGKIGLVTGTIGPARLGEVRISVRGGTEAFNAYAADREQTIERDEDRRGRVPPSTVGRREPRLSASPQGGN